MAFRKPKIFETRHLVSYKEILAEYFIATAADRRCRCSRRGISTAPNGLVAGVCQSDSIRGTAMGKCFYPEIDIEQEQTELTEKKTWIRKAERRLPSTARW